jgi:hypothetical protein
MSVVVAPEVQSIADLSLHVLYPLPHQDLSPSALDQIGLALHDRPVQLLLALRVVGLQKVLVLLQQTVVHLR